MDRYDELVPVVAQEESVLEQVRKENQVREGPRCKLGGDSGPQASMVLSVAP